ncbi:carbohydrate-binding module family 43 protein [Aplosporella prunicola CBS 121167]|uniref:1,3-beta-glucanosyltransferase n=1 Tax=Aplosporella prunicola CBS 121167 TaxID=1176127 RepID=A0A6A6BM41_9PEZI|nr:carbohydrate-binding module family 43 protein [Aplosporella prunicola CBS 121167]KAF2144473.1 carbohydrate-binding module family 43 protein [Aplosporella prunicola CBS 121167]
MKSFGIAAAAAALLARAVAADVPPIEIKGSKFFYSNNGTQFYMRGVAYQQEYSTNGTSSGNDDYTDPLSKPDNCKRDIPYLTQLRTNTIRVYAVNPDEDHDECMQMLQDAGIYVVSDLSSPGKSIDRSDAAWNDELYARYTAVIDAMAKYNNTLGFFAGNEVSNSPNNTDASAFVKAAVRDSKAYIKAKGYRTIGVGYATNDDADIRENMANYFNCGDDEASRIDFWGYNIYSWCGDSSFTKSGYDVRTKEFEDYSVPVFFAEYGCNDVSPRQFTDTPTLFGDKMNNVWSGGIVYMYFQEENDYGLVTIKDNKVSTLKDFSYYSKQIQSATPTGVNSASYTPSNTAGAKCPTVDKSWAATNSPLPPSPNRELCTCMYNSLGCTVSSKVDSEDYGELFGTVCGLNNKACQGIAHNATTGDFGAYSMCNSTEQLAFALNRYYELQDKSSDACSFSGSAQLASSTKPAGSCSSLMAQAGTAGTGQVTASPTSTAAASGAGGSDSKSSKGAAAGLTVPRFDFGMLQMGVYAVGAMGLGAGMILL